MPAANRLTVHGRVQGVWYRNWTVNAAQDLGLTGWVRNRDDGTVEIHAEGEKEGLDRLAALAQDGPPAADVIKIDRSVVPVEGHIAFEKRARRSPRQAGTARTPDQDLGFFAIPALKSGSFFATQSTNLRTAGSSSSACTSMPWRCSSLLVKFVMSVC